MKSSDLGLQIALFRIFDAHVLQRTLRSKIRKTTIFATSLLDLGAGI